jgi:hypothetical protein
MRADDGIPTLEPTLARWSRHARDAGRCTKRLLRGHSRISQYWSVLFLLRHVSRNDDGLEAR